MTQAVKQLRLVEGHGPVSAQDYEHVALFDADGESVSVGGGGGGTPSQTEWNDMVGRVNTMETTLDSLGDAHAALMQRVQDLEDAANGDN